VVSLNVFFSNPLDRVHLGFSSFQKNKKEHATKLLRQLKYILLPANFPNTNPLLILN
jgi:hypothetical protein